MTSKRAGFTLMEILAIMVVLTAIMMISAVVLVDAMRMEQSARECVSSTQARANLAELFRDDVRQAVDAPANWSTFAAGPQCLILKFADGKHVVYQFAEGTIQRVSADANKESRQTLGIGQDLADVSFSWTEKPSLAVMRVRYQSAPGRPSRVHETTASFGGTKR